MVKTSSTMLALGTPAPDFDLPDPTGTRHRLADFAGADALVVAFICNHCPYVKHIAAGLSGFGRDCAELNVAVVAINANDIEAHPPDAPELMRKEAEAHGYVFPYLYDASQAVAKAYRAACTPEFFLFNADRKLVYRGRFDAATPGNSEPVTGADLRAALEALLAGGKPDDAQTPSIGCNIKWKPGNAPDYFG
jgi:peroxiredoxin